MFTLPNRSIPNIHLIYLRSSSLKVMNFPPANLSSFHSDVFEKTALGQMCGKKQLFRDRYEVSRMLGRGGFGVTFLARDTSLPGNPKCVIKQLCPKVSDESALAIARQRFQREAKTLSLLGHHSQIPLLLDYFVIGEDFYLVQEYIHGLTLARLIRRYGPMSEEVVKRFLREIIPILEYVHKHGVIHRDIKPQNIIRCKQDGRLVLIDFGAVKEQISQPGESSIKGGTTNFIGTVGFAPPEQFSLRPVFASDIYAVGVTCLYLLTGKAPLDFQTDLHSGQMKWREVVQLSDSFAQVLDKMLKISLPERYQSISALKVALEEPQTVRELGECMNIQPRPSKNPPSQEDDSQENPNHHIAKVAASIRKWKAKRKKKQGTPIRRGNMRLLSSSGN